MPRLACRACGRQIYTVAPIAALFAEERRCPRCGSLLDADRRVEERRVANRRTNPPDRPGPPSRTGERRVAARRSGRRRRPTDGESPQGPGGGGGWVD